MRERERERFTHGRQRGRKFARHSWEGCTYCILMCSCLSLPFFSLHGVAEYGGNAILIALYRDRFGYSDSTLFSSSTSRKLPKRSLLVTRELVHSRLDCACPFALTLFLPCTGPIECEGWGLHKEFHKNGRGGGLSLRFCLHLPHRVVRRQRHAYMPRMHGAEQMEVAVQSVQ